MSFNNLRLISVNGVLVRNEVINKKFCCDLEKCKGACCTFESDYGAPLLQEEIPIIQSILNKVKKYLTQRNIEFIEQNGFYEINENGIFTKGINKRDCVFVYYDENGIAKCAIEKAFYNGEIDFKKPISCHLFPIRIHDFGGDILVFENFVGCSPALENGNKLDLPTYKFCKESLIRKYGENWYNELENLIKENK
ncbi:MAG TPA: DUF3109 family protein [Ignavibacteriales bacterium]|nr:DUF3109 family protein [Ignavibacteriales bacterium]HOL80276.1 DUF3109 family protein [Ignavibacteriales bacterium]HOM64555.1 DUF3109 family protein [Ignavibacteriales bacterium]HPD66652.1 DUF3109 family protein [Ignavibacteriales bacterium]HPP32465.1 DUF3109 family protein [Ignavibacteriales bacterium]